MTSYLSGLLTRDPTATFAYEVGERIPGLDAAQSIWTIHDGKLKKAPHTKVSVFNYDPKTGSDVTTEVAKNCLKRIKTLRHPNIVTYIGKLLAFILFFYFMNRLSRIGEGNLYRH